MNLKQKVTVHMNAGARAGAGVSAGRMLKTLYTVECHKPKWWAKMGLVCIQALFPSCSLPGWGFLRRLAWTDSFPNLVVDVGLDDSLDKHLKGSSYTAAWYIGLTDGTPTVAAADTMGSHGGWTEVSDYDEANRVTLTLGAVSGESVDNVGNEATFTIDTDDTTIGGAFVSSDDTKDGSSGILYGGGVFTAGDKTLDDNDVLTVTVTLTASAS